MGAIGAVWADDGYRLPSFAHSISDWERHSYENTGAQVVASDTDDDEGGGLIRSREGRVFDFFEDCMEYC